MSDTFVTSEPTTIRIALADDHPIFREGLKRLLATEPGFVVVGECADGLAVADLVRTLAPDVLLLDVAMPRVGGVEALAMLPEGTPTRVLLLTAGVTPPVLARAIDWGVCGVVTKDAALRRLVDAIRRVMEGRYVMGDDVTDTLAELQDRLDQATRRPYGLTARELDIVGAVASGAGNSEIAQRFSISLQTVKHHLTNVFDKTGTSTRLELALLAVKNGLGGESPRP